MGVSPSELWDLGSQEKALVQTGDSGVGLVLTPGGRSQPLVQMHGCSLQLMSQRHSGYATKQKVHAWENVS